MRARSLDLFVVLIAPLLGINARVRVGTPVALVFALIVAGFCMIGPLVHSQRIMRPLFGQLGVLLNLERLYPRDVLSSSPPPLEGLCGPVAQLGLSFAMAQLSISFISRRRRRP